MQNIYNIEGFYSKSSSSNRSSSSAGRSFSSAGRSFSSAGRSFSSSATRSSSAIRTVSNKPVTITRSFSKPSITNQSHSIRSQTPTKYTKTVINKKTETQNVNKEKNKNHNGKHHDKHRRSPSPDRPYVSPVLGGTGGGPYWGWPFWNYPYYPLYPLLDYIPSFPISPYEMISNRVIPFNEDYIYNTEDNITNDKSEEKKSSEKKSSEKKSKDKKKNKPSDKQIENFTLINLLLNILK